MGFLKWIMEIYFSTSSTYFLLLKDRKCFLESTLFCLPTEIFCVCCLCNPWGSVTISTTDVLLSALFLDKESMWHSKQLETDFLFF